MGIVGRYDLTGHYMKDGQRGSQFGEVALCSDGKLVGSVWDDDSGRGGKNHQKVLLGIRSVVDNTLAFLKLSPMTDVSPPSLLWYLRADASMEEVPREESYGGIWGVADGLPLISELGFGLSLGGIPSIEMMSESSVDELRSLYFCPGFLNRGEARSEGSGKTGGLSLRLRG